MKTITRTEKYVKALMSERELGVWQIMSKARKKYARHLVENYGCKFRILATRGAENPFPFFMRGKLCGKYGVASHILTRPSARWKI